MAAPREPSSGRERSPLLSLRRRALALGVLFVFFVAFVVVYWLMLSRGCGRRPDEGSGRLAAGQVYFVELVYEQDFAPVAGSGLRPRAQDRSLDGYVFRQQTKTLYPCSLRVKQSPASLLMIGRRLHFPHNQDHNVVQELGYAEDGYESWAVEQAPAPGEILMYGPTCWFRLPVRAEAAMKKDRCVVTVGDVKATLAAGERKEIWSAQRTYTASEYAGAIERHVNAARKERLTIPAELLKTRLPLDDAGKLTLYARLVAVYHGRVRRSPVHLVRERNAGIDSLQTGEYESAISHFDAYLKVIPDDEVIRQMRARAVTGKEQNIHVYRLQGTVSLPGGSAPDHPKSWIGIRRPDDPEDHSCNVSSVKGGKFEFHVEAGTYIATAYIPGFRPVSRTIQVQSDTSLEIQLTEDDRSP